MGVIGRHFPRIRWNYVLLSRRQWIFVFHNANELVIFEKIMCVYIIELTCDGDDEPHKEAQDDGLVHGTEAVETMIRSAKILGIYMYGFERISSCSSAYLQGQLVAIFPHMWYRWSEVKLMGYVGNFPFALKVSLLLFFFYV